MPGFILFTFGIAVGFAGPLLELLGQDEGGTFYLFGESSTGRRSPRLPANPLLACVTYQPYHP